MFLFKVDWMIKMLSKLGTKGLILFLTLRQIKVKVTQLCPTLCNPMDYTVQGILQARILEWVTFHSPRDLHNPGIKLRSLTLQTLFSS